MSTEFKVMVGIALILIAIAVVFLKPRIEVPAAAEKPSKASEGQDLSSDDILLNLYIDQGPERAMLKLSEGMAFSISDPAGSGVVALASYSKNVISFYSPVTGMHLGIKVAGQTGRIV